jgi:hypothetical protein
MERMYRGIASNGLISVIFEKVVSMFYTQFWSHVIHVSNQKNLEMQLSGLEQRKPVLEFFLKEKKIGVNLGGKTSWILVVLNPNTVASEIFFLKKILASKHAINNLY